MIEVKEFMLLVIVSYAIHLLILIPFFILIPLPMFLRGHEYENFTQTLLKLLKFYKVVIFISFGTYVIALLTGLYLRFELSLWIAIVILIWLAIGAFLWLTAKHFRLLLEEIESGAKTLKALEDTKRYSRLLTIAIATMFLFKYGTLYMM